MKQKHPNIVNLRDIEPRIESHSTRWRMGPHVGAKKLGASFFEIVPGRQAFPNHYHTANEVAIEAGDYIAFFAMADSSKGLAGFGK